jgi:hypothetical protein
MQVVAEVLSSISLVDHVVQHLLLGFSRCCTELVSSEGIRRLVASLEPRTPTLLVSHLIPRAFLELYVRYQLIFQVINRGLLVVSFDRNLLLLELSPPCVDI